MTFIFLKRFLVPWQPVYYVYNLGGHVLKLEAII